MTISTALFDGLLEVADAEKFRHALCFGVGRAKGFGCGLLTVAPIKDNLSAESSE
ncbi:type I-E CRISPR-associated protein Cas6/Cse3/CasE [Bifidobacterium sp. ESL0798]|uniref:type I-E CRISPR-associated protein Cas6/Cse3/CasE n=1 Tax=Bifidobacterium sp. ESL0798 TaxID=2983235 RepID=UPI0023FA0DC0|nr:type I-E CRISPR-associated protein Cas6/Cse3/CasE [Bifidobacterium sp. ESL0798]WEV73650.1 type I-E CRISPR-associated protein Cas6/Cse3/CasE [Bifidobacterium sp. ESL0798]